MPFSVLGCVLLLLIPLVSYFIDSGAMIHRPVIQQSRVSKATLTDMDKENHAFSIELWLQHGGCNWFEYKNICPSVAWRQAIIWTNDGLLSLRPWEIAFNGILFEIKRSFPQANAFVDVDCRMTATLFYVGLSVLINSFRLGGAIWTTFVQQVITRNNVDQYHIWKQFHRRFKIPAIKNILDSYPSKMTANDLLRYHHISSMMNCYMAQT